MVSGGGKIKLDNISKSPVTSKVLYYNYTKYIHGIQKWKEYLGLDWQRGLGRGIMSTDGLAFSVAYVGLY